VVPVVGAGVVASLALATAVVAAELGVGARPDAGEGAEPPPQPAATRASVITIAVVEGTARSVGRSVTSPTLLGVNPLRQIVEWL